MLDPPARSIQDQRWPSGRPQGVARLGNVIEQRSQRRRRAIDFSSGLAAVAIEPIAARLGATKGSGYWHFANRAALVEATLQRWEHQTEEIIERVDLQQDPLVRLRTLLTTVTDQRGPQAVELSLLASVDDPAVAPVVERVIRRRIAYTRKLFLDLGFESTDAADRARMAYAMYVGHPQLARTLPGAIPPGKQLSSYLDSILDRLLSRSPAEPVGLLSRWDC